MTPCWKPILAIAASALLAACSVAPQRPAPVAARAEVEDPAPPSPAPTPLPTPVATADPSPWVRLASRFEMPGCDYSAEVLRWAQHYTRSPQTGPSPSAAGEAQPILTLRGGLSALLNCRDHASLCNPRQPHLHVLGLKKRL